MEARCADHGLSLARPRDPSQRGSQVCLTRTKGAHAIAQALIARGVIGDSRAGDPSTSSGRTAQLDILRFGFTPLYVGFDDVWQAVKHLRQILDTGEWQQAQFKPKNAMT